MKAAVVIPARLGATRLPRKPLRDLGGQPLVVRVWERVSRMGVGDRVVVATDQEEVAGVLRHVGADVVMTSPDCASGTERVTEVAARPADAAGVLVRWGPRFRSRTLVGVRPPERRARRG